MKKIIVAVVLLTVIALAVSAETIFVTARICPVFQDASTGSARLGSAAQNDELQVMDRKGDWIKVTTPSGTSGFVQSLFTGKEPSLSRAATSDGLKNVSSVVTRRRASAYTTSAAATRGLSTDNVRERENMAFKDYDFSTIQWLETFVFTDDQVMGFAKKEGLAF